MRVGAPHALRSAWLCGLWLLFLFGVRRNKLKACLMAVFVYVMAIILTGTQVLEGVPDQVGAKQWRDPHHRLTPGAKYLLHNHANVVRESPKPSTGCTWTWPRVISPPASCYSPPACA